MSYQSKKILKNAVYKALSWEPVLSYSRKTRLHNKCVILMYHEVADDSDEIEAWTVVRRSGFIKQMEYLSRHFNIVSLGEAIHQMANSRDMNRPMAVITFDDGYAGNKNVLLPIVESMNIPVTVFVSTKAVQEQIVYWYDRLIRALQGNKVIDINLTHLSLSEYRINRCKGAENWREIERLLRDLKTLKPDAREKAVSSTLADLQSSEEQTYHIAPLTINDVHQLADCPLVTIGAHSHCHNILTQLAADDIRRSVRMSKDLLETWISRKVDYFAYPNGNYDDLVCNILREEGFKCSLTTVSRPWEMGEPLFTIPRIGVGRYESFDHFKAKVSGVFA